MGGEGKGEARADVEGRTEKSRERREEKEKKGRTTGFFLSSFLPARQLTSTSLIRHGHRQTKGVGRGVAERAMKRLFNNFSPLPFIIIIYRIVPFAAFVELPVVPCPRAQVSSSTCHRGRLMAARVSTGRLVPIVTAECDGSTELQSRSNVTLEAAACATSWDCIPASMLPYFGTLELKPRSLEVGVLSCPRALAELHGVR